MTLSELQDRLDDMWKLHEEGYRWYAVQPNGDENVFEGRPTRDNCGMGYFVSDTSSWIYGTSVHNRIGLLTKDDAPMRIADIIKALQARIKVMKGESQNDAPDYYTYGGIETIEYIEAKLTPEEFRGFLKGNILKYVSRAGKKEDEAKDLGKALDYTKMLIDRLKRLEEEQDDD